MYNLVPLHIDIVLIHTFIRSFSPTHTTQQSRNPGAVRGQVAFREFREDFRPDRNGLVLLGAEAAGFHDAARDA